MNDNDTENPCAAFDFSVAAAPARFAFRTEKSRQIVRGIADAIVETTSQVKMTASEAHLAALMLVRGARIATQFDSDPHAQYHVTELLDALTRGGIDAVRKLVTTVTGQELQAQAA